MLFLVYLSIEESTSGVPEYNRGRKRSEVPAKQKSSLAGSLLLYLYSFVYCLLQLFQRLGQSGVRGTLPLSRKISILSPPWPASSLTLKCCNRSHR